MDEKAAATRMVLYHFRLYERVARRITGTNGLQFCREDVKKMEETEAN